MIGKIFPPKIELKDRSISVTVVGGGFGESIIVNVGGSFVFLVDCCSLVLGSGKSGVTGNILRKVMRASDNPLFGFALLTHPHQDHFSGLVKVIKKFQKDTVRVCFFNGTTEAELADLFYEQDVDLERSVSRYKFYKNFRSLLDCYYKDLDPAQRMCASEGTQICQFTAVSGDAEIPVTISCLAPSTDDSRKFLRQARLRNFLELASSYSPQLRQECNRVSVVVKAQFGNTCILLGGDAEKDAWEGILAKNRETDLGCNIFKVSHHGSSNGVPASFLPILSHKKHLGEDTVAIIAPASGHGLPEAAMVETLANHFGDVLLTVSGEPSIGDANQFRVRNPFCQQMRTIPQWKNCHVTVTFDDLGKRITKNSPRWAV